MNAPRRVTVTLELHTNVPLGNLRRAGWWQGALPPEDGMTVIQAQANVVKTQAKNKKQR